MRTDEPRIHLSVPVRCTQVNQAPVGLGEQGQGQELTEKKILHIGKILLQILLIIPDSRAVKSSSIYK